MIDSLYRIKKDDDDEEEASDTIEKWWFSSVSKIREESSIPADDDASNAIQSVFNSPKHVGENLCLTRHVNEITIYT